ncbi:phosphoenolpyruvate phosphomutase-domain-containing protein [Fusarium tricinctum]|uniref:Phosphoenolpyruvate phosphomutase-domain-containing protein n=1 Tax=Fusarium tricinctum TaxID=61284 RepID=A0A8K0RTW5_9HYPO|nr:phosphoenolpyruvate phosphomutase-domain-containing protein [Fusarium tricinctum]
MSPNNDVAKTLKSLHIPHHPLVLSNVWDVASLNAVLSINTEESKPVKAIATASWAFAAVLGIKDEDLTMEQNLTAIQCLSPIVARASLPLSVDLQDGYGPCIREAVMQAVQAGAHGANLEDSIPSQGLGNGIEGSLYSLSHQTQRIQLACQAASDAGCPDFVINARCDIFALGDILGLDNDAQIQEAVKRGKVYLEAGATTVFYWRGYGAGMTEDEVRKLVNELGGRVAIRLGQTQNALSVAELGKIGVARISVGPSLFQIAMHAAKKSAMDVLQGGHLQEV